MCFVVFRSWPPLCWHALACLSRLASRCLATCWSQRFKGERAKSCANLGCSIGCYVNSTTGPKDLVYIDLQILHCDAASWREPYQTCSNYKPLWAFQAIDKKVHQATLHRNGKFLFPRRYSILKPSNTRKTVSHSLLHCLQCLQQILSLGVILPEKFVTHTDTVSPPVGKKPRCWQSAVTFTLHGRHVATLNKHERTEYIPKYPNTMQNVSLRACCSLSHGKKRQGKHRLVRFGEQFSLCNYRKTVEYTWPYICDCKALGSDTHFLDHRSQGLINWGS